MMTFTLSYGTFPLSPSPSRETLSLARATVVCILFDSLVGLTYNALVSICLCKEEI